MEVRASHLLVKHQGSRRAASWRDPDGVVITKRTKGALDVAIARPDLAQLRSRVAVTYHLMPMSEEETSLVSEALRLKQLVHRRGELNSDKRKKLLRHLCARTPYPGQYQASAHVSSC